MSDRHPREVELNARFVRCLADRERALDRGDAARAVECLGRAELVHLHLQRSRRMPYRPVRLRDRPHPA